ncbi:MAG: RHS repeat-associated core domain-containing protein, partial [Acidobacteria bacterium]|nr:RHS repeat-associated core domain-containing protein [Acidobacteriota bacterium]
VNSFSYDAFGNSVSSSATRYGFTGREADAETGLMYYRARFYDPVVGRFISEDPIGLAGGINLYGYVGNDPQNGTDPLGLYDIDVHYYLTYYIVRNHPCYTEKEARDIANANQGVDENPFTEPGPGNRESNSNYHGLHGNPHGPYLERHWPKNSARYAQRMGIYLHYLQDTFSHNGFTDSDIGHGYMGHWPDNTNTSPGKVMQMANATWDALNRFAMQRGFCSEPMTERMRITIAIFAKLPSGDNERAMFFNDITSDGKHPGWFGNWTETNPSYLYRKREALGVGPRKKQ